MDIITVDFETYYTSTYSLSKLTTEAYIRDDQFEVIGVSVRVNDGLTKWFSGTMAATEKFLSGYDWDNAVAVAHHAAFDMAILNWRFDIRPKRIVDTLSMARALHGVELGLSLAALAKHYQLGEKGTEVLNALGKRRKDFTPEELTRYGKYCINDTDLTYDLFEELAKGFPVSELKLIDLTIRMFTEPTLVLDAPKLEAHLANVKLAKEELLGKTLITKENLMSNPKLAETLTALGVEPPMKISLTTGKETYAFAKTDEGFKALLEHENLLVQALVAARLGVKSTLEETRTERFIQIASRGTLPVPLRYYGAHTGRWSAEGSVNLQNIPRTSPLKYTLKAPEGYSLINSDSSQIEARTLAWLAEQDDLVEAFDKGEDVYKIMASSIYNVPIEEVTKDQRFVGKTTILGAGYGMGAAKFQAQLKTFGVYTELVEAQRIIDVYRETYPKIPELWAQAGEALTAMMRDDTAPIGKDGVLVVDGIDGIRLPNGLYIRYPNLRKQKNEENRFELMYDVKKGRSSVPTRVYGGKAVENLCQALARIIIGEQMLMISRRYKVVMTVHDSVVPVVKNEDLAEALVFIQDCMRMRPRWALGLPLNCEAGYGYNYGEC